MQNDLNQYLEWLANNPLLLILLALWVLVWKGLALWKAAELRQKGWFVAILLLNTLGILEIIYYFFVAKKYEVIEIEEK